MTVKIVKRMIKRLNEKALEVLDRIVNHYHDYSHWIQGYYYSVEDSNCLEGALRRFGDNSILRFYIVKIIREEDPGYNEVVAPADVIVSWNDATNRTYEDVMLLLKKVASRLEDNDAL